MVEKAIVKILDPETDEGIHITLDYDKDESTLDYNVTFTEHYEKPKNLDFRGFLADILLNNFVINK